MLIEILDECGGLPAGNVGDLFRPFEELADGSAAGLGLAFSRWDLEANDGRIYARNLPEATVSHREAEKQRNSRRGSTGRAARRPD